MAGTSLSRVSKSYGPVEVIREFSLEIGAGKLVVLLGPSGSGKTTLLRMIAGLETIGRGTLTIDRIRLESLSGGEEGWSRERGLSNPKPSSQKHRP